jgi:hypothetical protein
LAVMHEFTSCNIVTFYNKDWQQQRCNNRQNLMFLSTLSSMTLEWPNCSLLNRFRTWIQQPMQRALCCFSIKCRRIFHQPNKLGGRNHQRGWWGQIKQVVACWTCFRHGL